MPEARPRSNPDEDTKLNFEFFPICFMDKDYSSSPFLIHAQSKFCKNLHNFLWFFVPEVLLLLPQLQLRFMFSTFFGSLIHKENLLIPLDPLGPPRRPL